MQPNDRVSLDRALSRLVRARRSDASDATYEKHLRLIVERVYAAGQNSGRVVEFERLTDPVERVALLARPTKLAEAMAWLRPRVPNDGRAILAAWNDTGRPRRRLYDARDRLDVTTDEAGRWVYRGVTGS